ncbi:hypothetical protein ACIQ6Y_15870 [Streptomyces sp. NPDC096205]|uniref:hypothetical protein n=1 Tax=Streptomyces sp. NPDC096205 TaxID=3366081 RepID=UPI0037F7870D
MPRGRHRHSPPLHRLLPPSAIAGVSVVCALGPWVFTEAALLRSLAAVAAVTAVTGAVVMRRWDTQAGKQVADLARARASDEWRHEERVAELESDLDESRELRGKLEQRLRAKRAELAKLRNEHAALLRRYATAETERASALEGRRLLELESGAPARAALPPVPAPRPAEVEAASRQPDTAEADHARVAQPERPGVFSPEGSQLFLRANAALSRFAGDGRTPAKTAAPAGNGGTDGPAAEAAPEDEAQGKTEAAAGHERAAAAPNAPQVEASTPARDRAPDTATDVRTSPQGSEESQGSEEGHGSEESQGSNQDAQQTTEAQQAGDVQAPADPAPQPVGGHFAVPTAVAVVPAAPARRPTVEGGFDFFGTKAPEPAALAAVQNEDLADVVGQEALDLHKAESEARFRPAGEETRAVGQVIDLTAHDETEQIDVQGLRSAAS